MTEKEKVCKRLKLPEAVGQWHTDSAFPPLSFYYWCWARRVPTQPSVHSSPTPCPFFFMPTTLADWHKQSNVVLSKCEYFINITLTIWELTVAGGAMVWNEEKSFTAMCWFFFLLNLFAGWLSAHALIYGKIWSRHSMIRYKLGVLWWAVISFHIVFRSQHRLPGVNSIWLQVWFDLTLNWWPFIFSRVPGCQGKRAPAGLLIGCLCGHVRLRLAPAGTGAACGKSGDE